METRKPDYKNWMPKGMIQAFAAAAAAFLAVGIVARCLMDGGTLKTVIIVIAYAAAVILAGVTVWCAVLYHAFDYNGPRQMSKQIIDGLSDYVVLPEGGVGLDVGCGSGALTIACAKKNPRARMVGIDRWGAEYASYSQLLCAQNAVAEGVRNVSFQQGDANKLIFPDESFDAVTSNYVSQHRRKGPSGPPARDAALPEEGRHLCHPRHFLQGALRRHGEVRPGAQGQRLRERGAD